MNDDVQVSGSRRRAAQKAAGSFAAQLTDSDSDDALPSDASSAYPSPSKKKGNTTVTYGGKGRTIAPDNTARQPARRKSGVTAATPTKREAKVPKKQSQANLKKRRLSSSPLSELSRSRSASDVPPSTTVTTSTTTTATLPRASPLKRAPGSSTSLSELSDLSSVSRPSTPKQKQFRPPPRPVSSMFAADNSPVPSQAAAEEEEDEWDLGKLGSLVWVRIDKHGNTVSNESEEDEYASDTAFWWPGRILNDNDNIDALPLKVSLFGKPSAYSPQTTEIRTPSSANILSMHSPRHIIRFNSNNFTLSMPSSSYQASPRKKQKTDLETRWNDAVAQMVAKDAEDNDGLPSASSLFAFAGVSSFSSLLGSGPGRNHKKPKTPKSKATPARPDPDEDERWSPPPPDALLEIPGELVLARESRNRTEYWPAKVMAYVPPAHRRAPPRYELQYLDQTTHRVTRDLFYTCEERGFVDCKLGQFESSVSLEEAHNDDHDEDDDGVLEDGASEPESEEPPSLPPPPRIDFCALPIAAQLAYVKPVLSLIMQEKYEPARARHAAFMKGGAARVNVCKSAAAKGDLTALEVAQLQRRLSRWILRDEPEGEMQNSDGLEVATGAASDGPQGRGYDDPASGTRSSEVETLPSSPAEPPPSSLAVTDDIQAQCLERQDEPSPRANSPEAEAPARQPATFESLSGVEKVEYCSNVLLPEAIIQLLLWRWEKRTTLEPLEDSEEETRLYKVGLEKAEETDWVHDVLRLREAKSKRLKKAPQSNGNNTGGTRSRPRRA
ncbi:hypothetical protein GLOTRDRAFT_136657 [Gloeophyllum trabeum ATCC 11539]|uniref:PWWP domain-containing protein n=1 Tax=Gloeophyllum trabeum (strain ATCC 11539 / FP-39264 / Madison 617) TaxID=670483 RepID=S7QD51_GLOTA|nr:uncharacterized protein GLOTRDRAFT_136657 [Gloeophyllum trabeum ATCC 11539]EPQ57786.1 hypothetical protein GLOTRDRAFT_136657 [Gloeophyllum trabeum ATCC 11539]